MNSAVQYWTEMETMSSSPSPTIAHVGRPSALHPKLKARIMPNDMAMGSILSSMLEMCCQYNQANKNNSHINSHKNILKKKQAPGTLSIMIGELGIKFIRKYFQLRKDLNHVFHSLGCTKTQRPRPKDRKLCTCQKRS